MTAYANRVGEGCGRTRNPVRWYASEVVDLPRRRRRTHRSALRGRHPRAAGGRDAARPDRSRRRRTAPGGRGRAAVTVGGGAARRGEPDGADSAPAVDPGLPLLLGSHAQLPGGPRSRAEARRYLVPHPRVLLRLPGNGV